MNRGNELLLPTRSRREPKKKNLRLPQSYAEAFDVLGENQILDPDFAYKFAAIAGFRNFLAHDYEKIDQEIICGQVLKSLDEVDIFIEQIKAALALG